ncbi:DNA polymerase/3'-5' exonuclease PolX [Candidatus Woesearchaeota archaeon]|nr:DNA polymerase/3'-5' exonuclease PolX [Candidatus Woesearchaeota archaeon]
MKNKQVAKLLREIGDLLEVRDVKFKPYAYKKAAQAIEALSEDVGAIYKKGGIKALKDIPGVGQSIAEKIEEFIKTGKIKYLEQEKKKLPVDIDELTSIEGLGVKKVQKLYKKLKIKSVADLKKAIKQKKIRGIAGFGEKSEERMLESMSFTKKSKKRMPLGYIFPTVTDMISQLKELKEVQKIDVAGSVRRMKETIGDVDILVATKSPKIVMDRFTKFKDVKRVIAKGPTRSSVRLDSGVQVDIRVIPLNIYGSALQYFTGSKAHNIAVRKIAIKKGYKLSEYGLFKGKTVVASKTEEEIYRKLGMQCPDPEIRQDTGEVEAALKKNLPNLVKQKDVLGDLHVHSKWSDGAFTIKEMALAYKKAGYKYISINDHTGSLKIAKALDSKRLLKQLEEIKKVNRQMSGFHIFSGCEVNIKADGTPDIPDKILKQLDIVVAAVHSGFRSNNTKRIITAMENPNIDIIGHPTGGVYGKRQPYTLNFDKILDKAKSTGTALEINCFPTRMDLDTSHIRDTVAAKVMLSIGSDAHSTDHVRFFGTGIGLARRGWCDKGNLLNTMTIERLKKWTR